MPACEDYLTRQPLEDRETAFRLIEAQAQTGALVTFEGIVRADRSGQREVTALFYAAYEAMANSEMAGLVQNAHRRWTLTGIYLRHRLGLVRTGQISLIVSVSAGHRAEAYAASEFIVEGIKHDVPIWKQICYSDEAREWSRAGELSSGVGRKTYALV